MKLGIARLYSPSMRYANLQMMLHENLTASDLQHANDRLRLVLHHANRRYELGPQHHQRRLLLHPTKQLHPAPTAASSSMPPSSEAPSAQHACSPRARSTPASSGSSSRAPFSPSSSTRWLPSSQTPPPPIPIYTAHLRRSRADPVCDAAELSLLGRGRLHLQQAHSGPIPWVVDAV